MASINCPRCGAPVDASSKFCGNCGYSPQSSGTATSHPLQGQPGGGLPSSYQTPSLPTNPADGKPLPTYLADQTSSSAPTYRVDGSPLSPYPSNNPSSAYPYPAAGTPPPPPFPVGGGTPSSPMYSTSGANFPTAAPANSSASYPIVATTNSDPNMPSPPPPRRRGNRGLAIISIIALIVLLVGAGFYVVNGTSLLKGKTAANPTATANTKGGTSITPTVAATTTASTGITPTVTTTPLTDTSTTPTVIATNPTTSSTSYTAIQPGPGCDTNGGTWTPQDISSITCGTQLSVNGSSRGYLYLQLPNNRAFSANNVIGVSSSVSGGGYCVGLAEQGTNTGYLAQFCGDGNWAIYSISNGGAVVQTLAKSLTSTRANEQLSLTIKGTTLSFSIDTEVHNVTITAIQPTKVAIAYSTGYYSGTVTVTNFSYTAM